jgi:hypothetical protein
VKGYYASISHDLLFALVRRYVHDPFLLQLVYRFLKHAEYHDGIYAVVQKGISLGCPLSPLLGALFLKPLDDAMAQTGLFYLRYMDDWVVMAPTRWKLRRAIATVNQTLDALELEKHPDKTSIGRVTAGFDFLGTHFRVVESGVAADCAEAALLPTESDCPAAVGDGLPVVVQDEVAGAAAVSVRGPVVKTVVLRPAVKTIRNYFLKISRLYEQGADAGRIEEYVRRWWAVSWVSRRKGQAGVNRRFTAT